MPTGVRPYLFFGPAISRNNFSGSFTYESFSGTTNYRSQNDFAMVGGLGVDIPLTDMTHFFVQGEVVCNFVDNDTANFGTLDQPSVFLPIELGLTFGR
jgi:outer membrane protein W